MLGFPHSQMCMVCESCSLRSLQLPCLSLCFSVLMRSVSTSDLRLKIFPVVQIPCLSLCSWTNSTSTTKPKRASSHFSAAVWKRLFHKSWQLQRQSLSYEFWLFFSKRAFRLNNSEFTKGVGKLMLAFIHVGTHFTSTYGKNIQYSMILLSCIVSK